MKISGKSLLAGAAALLAVTIPASAWEQQGTMKSLPGGGLALKEMPSAQGNLQNLPGVNLNPKFGLNDSAGNCTQRQVTGYRHGFGEQSATVNECSFGNFSISTYNSGGGSGAGSYNPFPVPGPLQQAGPPAGSGGLAPSQPSMFGRPLH